MAALVVLVALVGAWLSLLIGGRVDTDVGPVVTRLSISPSLTGDTVVTVPPLGALRLDTHDGPLTVNIDVSSVDAQSARAIFADPGKLDGLQDRIVSDLRHGLLMLALRGVLVAVLGSAVFGLVVFRRWRTAAVCGLTTLAVLAASGVAGIATWNPLSVNEPQYSGLLANAPTLVGNAEDIVDNFAKYRVQLAKIVTNVSKLYDTTLTLPTYQPSPDTIRVLLVSDIHDNPAAWNVIRSTAAQFQVQAIIDAGDITDHGLAAENKTFQDIRTLGVPYVWVRGNHDSYVTQEGVAALPNTYVLDNSIVEVAGLRILGVGDPRYTPDKNTRDAPEAPSIEEVGKSLADQARAAAAKGKPVDVVVVHDPDAARQTDGTVPLALSGHIHHRLDEVLPKGTRLFVEGSTGGAGLRGLEGEQPTPIELSVLYFDRQTRTLQAWDDIQLGGLGLESASIQRHVAKDPGAEGSTPSPTPSPGATPSGGAPSGGAPSGGVPSAGAPSGGAPSGAAPSGAAPAPSVAAAAAGR